MFTIWTPFNFMQPTDANPVIKNIRFVHSKKPLIERFSHVKIYFHKGVTLYGFNCSTINNSLHPMKKIIFLSIIVIITLFSCKKEEDQITPAPATTQASTTKTFRVVVTATPAGGGTQPINISYKPTDSTGNWEWTETSNTGSFEKNVQAEKDSTLMVFVYGDFSTLFAWNVKLYEGSSVVKEFTKACTHSGILYKVQ